MLRRESDGTEGMNTSEANAEPVMTAASHGAGEACGSGNLQLSPSRKAASIDEAHAVMPSAALPDLEQLVQRVRKNPGHAAVLLATFAAAIRRQADRESQDEARALVARQAEHAAEEARTRTQQQQRVSEDLKCQQLQMELPTFHASYFKQKRCIGRGSFGDAYLETIAMGEEGPRQVVIKIAKRVGTGHDQRGIHISSRYLRAPSTPLLRCFVMQIDGNVTTFTDYDAVALSLMKPEIQGLIRGRGPNTMAVLGLVSDTKADGTLHCVGYMMEFMGLGSLRSCLIRCVCALSCA